MHNSFQDHPLRALGFNQIHSPRTLNPILVLAKQQDPPACPAKVFGLGTRPDSPAARCVDSTANKCTEYAGHTTTRWHL